MLLNGENVEPQPIEDMLCCSPYIKFAGGCRPALPCLPAAFAACLCPPLAPPAPAIAQHGYLWATKEAWEQIPRRLRPRAARCIPAGTPALAPARPALVCSNKPRCLPGPHALC